MLSGELRWDFAASWAVEDHPDGEIFTEILEMMLSAGSNEAEITACDHVPTAIMNQYAPPLHYHV
jgi:hypothetical protein